MKKVRLYAPPEYWLIPEQDRGFCGPGRGIGDWLVIDWPFREACAIHDFMYAKGKTLEDKQEADRVFLNNCLRIARSKNWLIRKPLIGLAWAFSKSVSTFGGPAFWNGKNKWGSERVI